MTLVASILLAVLAVSSSDRLAMADRLFNKGDVASARAEYLSLKGARDIDAAELAYRLVASAKALAQTAVARAEAEAFLKAYPTHAYADKVRLVKALVGSDAEKRLELKMLDRDDCATAIRAEALYRLAELTGETALFARVFKTDPKGRFAPYAKIAHASRLLESKDAAERRQGVAELMELVYGGDPTLAKDALYMAAVHSYREGRYGECTTLLKRYQKSYPADGRTGDVRRLTAQSELMDGKYAAALALATDETDETMAYVRAVASFRLDAREDARRLSEKYLADFPQGRNRTAVELQLARLQFDDAVKSNDVAAIGVAARTCQRLSKSPSDRLLVAWACEKAGETEKAEAEYAAVARECPKTAQAADALYRRAMSLLRRDAYSAAELSLAEALNSGCLDKTHETSAYYWRGLAARRLGHTAEAVDFLKKALSGTLALDEQREARLVLADIDLAEGRRDEAVRAYAELVRQGAIARMSAAKILSVGKLLKGDEARTCAKALAANGSPEWRQLGLVLLGDVEEAEGNLTASAEAWKSALAESCTTEAAASAALKYGLYLVRDGDPSAAEVVLKRAVDLNKGDNEARAAAYLGLARAALLRDDRESAKGYATVIVTLFETSSSAAAAKEILK